jgi:TatD DNase family protein
MFIDSHAHLDDERFDEDRDQLIKSLNGKGIELILNPGADLLTSKKAVELSEKYNCIYAAVGCHPHDSKDMTNNTIDMFKDMAKREKVIAIGEIGLDYYYDNTDRVTQRKWFREQIKLAKELDIPYIVHDRDAHEDVLNIMKKEHYSGARGILHCFSSSTEMAREFIKLGFMISIGGPVTFKKSKTPKIVAFDIPLEHLLIETDSPYLTPEPFRGKRNEPAYVRYVAEEIARIKNIPVDVVAHETNKNFKKLFNL